MNTRENCNKRRDKNIFLNSIYHLDLNRIPPYLKRNILAKLGFAGTLFSLHLIIPIVLPDLHI
jgi:hypothetical protein